MKEREAEVERCIAVKHATTDHFREVEVLVVERALYSELPARLLDDLGYVAENVRDFRLESGEVVQFPVGTVWIRDFGTIHPVLCIFGTEALVGRLYLASFGMEFDAGTNRLVPGVFRMPSGPRRLAAD